MVGDSVVGASGIAAAWALPLTSAAPTKAVPPRKFRRDSFITSILLYSAFAPPLVGHLSATLGLAKAIGLVTACALGLSLLALAVLPETRGKELLVYD